MSDTELRIERLIPASPERVFMLWSEADQLVKWWGPEGTHLPAHAFDLRPGGFWRTTMQRADGKQNTVSGVYRAIEPPRRVVFTWAWEDEHGARGHETEVTVTFTPAPGGTKLILVQKEFATIESRDLHSQGWGSTFNRLARLAG